MNPQNTQRLQDQPIQIGPRHGYRIDGDHVFINAELQMPPYHSGGEWALELWATDAPYREGALTGVRVAQVALELPTPIGPHVHQVDTRAAATLPLQGRIYSMVQALIQRGQDAHGTTTVHAFANYAEPQTFFAPHFAGTVGYSVQGQAVVLEAGGVFNPRARDNLSGTLAMELWAFPLSGASTEGLRLAAAEIDCVAGQSELPSIERRVAFNDPPAGRYQLALLLKEWTFAHGYVARDRRDFDCVYEGVVPEPRVSSPVRAPAAAVVAPPVVTTATPAPAVPATARPVERLRLVAPAAVAPAAPAQVAVPVQAAHPAKPAAPTQAVALEKPPGPVSIQTATLEELAAVKGLNLKLAKEIIKARPFASLGDLVKVRGIGRKTVDSLKGRLTI